MSDPRRGSAGGKVTILSTGEAAQSSAESSSAATTIPKSASNARNARRKVGTNLERSFVDPGAGSSRQAQQSQQQQQSRQVLKAGKPVTSAPTPMQQRPLTELEKAFAAKSVQDQRWLLSFPLALKQLYFGFAESTNHEQILVTLINRFPELLAGTDQHPSAILLAIQKGNWTPAKHFINACVKGEKTSQLVQRCPGIESRTLLIESVLTVAQPDFDNVTDIKPAIDVMLALVNARPKLLSMADFSGKNPLHHCAEQPKRYENLFHPLLSQLRQLALDSQNLARCLGNALATGDIAGKKPIDLLLLGESPAAPAVEQAIRQLMAELPTGVEDPEDGADEPMTDAGPSLLLLSGSSAKDAVCSALNKHQKSAEFVQILMTSLSSAEPQAMLLSSLAQAEKAALDWFGSSQRDAIKQALIDVGLADLCDLVDRF